MMLCPSEFTLGQTKYQDQSSNHPLHVISLKVVTQENCDSHLPRPRPFARLERAAVRLTLRLGSPDEPLAKAHACVIWSWALGIAVHARIYTALARRRLRRIETMTGTFVFFRQFDWPGRLFVIHMMLTDGVWHLRACPL